MKRTMYRKLTILLGVVMLLLPQVAECQIYYDSIDQYAHSNRNKPQTIDWMNASENRYTIAIRPLYVPNNGLKIDFELELPRKGSWLQIDGIVRFNTYDDSFYWEAGDNWFTKLNGCGLGVYYKTFFRPNGWYYDAGVLMNYYGVSKPGIVSETYVEDGMTFLRYDRKTIKWNFFKPSLNFNIGKQLALSSHLFLDLFAGIGYTYSFHSDGLYGYFSSYNPRSFSYRGLYVSGGFRIGILWNCATKQ